MRVGRFDRHAVMPCAGGDEDVGGGRTLAGFPATARQLTSLFPDFIGNPEFRDVVLIGLHCLPLAVAATACPELEPNHTAPCCASALQEMLDSLAHGRLARGAEVLDPRRGVDEGHFVRGGLTG